MQKITSITKEQAARFGEWADKWIKVGLSTEPADFEKASEAALRAYKLCNLNRPMVILRMSSPYGATVGGAIAHEFLRSLGRASGRADAVRSQVGSQVRSQVESQVGSQVESQVRSQVESQVWSQVESQVRSQVGSQVESQVGSQVESQVGSQVESQVGSESGPLARAASDGFNNYCGGSFWANWCAYVTFFRDVMGWEDPTLDKFAIDEDLARSCGWVWWHENILAISDRPSELHRDEQGRLHNESGPSIAYRDGWTLHHWHGALVPKFVIDQPETITAEHVEKEMNAEVRRVMVQRMGMERYISSSNLKPVHSDDFGTLYRKEQPNDEALVVVKVRNSTPEPDGSVKDYFLRVPPTITKAREAVAWTFDLKPEEYLPAVQT